MKRYILTIVLVFVITFPAIAADGMIDISSVYSVKETADRVEKILKKKGMTIFKRVKHSEAAEKIGINIRDTELIIFGNPKVGSLLMKCAQSASIDLPQKYLIWKGENNRVWISYNDPVYLKRRHNIRGCDGVILKIKKALHGIAKKAASK